MTANLLGLIKAAGEDDERLKKELDAANKLLEIYKKDPDADTKEDLLEQLSNVIAINPFDTRASGWLGPVKDESDAIIYQAMRGNHLRANTRLALAPLQTAINIAEYPLVALTRALNPNFNTKYYNTDEMRLEKDPKKLYRAAKEMIDLKSIGKADPSDYFEHTKNYLSRFKHSIPEALARTPSGIFGLAQDIVGLPAAVYNSLTKNDHDKFMDKAIHIIAEDELKQESLGKVDPEIIQIADDYITDYLNNELKAENKRK